MSIFSVSQFDFLCYGDHEQDWQPFPVDAYSDESADHSYMHTYIQETPWTHGPITEQYCAPLFSRTFYWSIDLLMR